MVQVNIGNARISLMAGDRDHDGRTVYKYAITLPNSARCEGTDLRSGCQGGTEREGMACLLTFLSACGESFPDGENADLMPAVIAEWAAGCQDELAMASEEFEN